MWRTIKIPVAMRGVCVVTRGCVVATSLAGDRVAETCAADWPLNRHSVDTVELEVAGSCGLGRLAGCCDMLQCRSAMAADD
jgi:hypothetical protein